MLVCGAERRCDVVMLPAARGSGAGVLREVGDQVGA